MTDTTVNNSTEEPWKPPHTFEQTPLDAEARCIIVCCRNGMRHAWWSRDPLKPHFIAWCEMPAIPSDKFMADQQ